MKEVLKKSPQLIDIPDSQGRTLLMMAAMFAWPEYVELFLKQTPIKQSKTTIILPLTNTQKGNT